MGADNDRANNTTDGDGAPDTADMTDTDAYESMTQTQPSGFLDTNSTVSDPDDISSAESEPHSGNLSDPDDVSSAKSESPLENVPNPPSSTDTRPQLVVERFPHGKPGAPINGMRGSSIYESSQDALGGAVWAPFQSQCDWDVAYWAKMSGPSCSALTNLLSIPNVRHSFGLLPVLLNVV